MEEEKLQPPREPYKCAIDIPIYLDMPPALPPGYRRLMPDLTPPLSTKPPVHLIPYNLVDIAYELTAPLPAKSKPTATVLPNVTNTHCSKSVQTDSLSIDLDSLIHVQDIFRSHRIQGLHSSLGRARCNTDDKDFELELLRRRNQELEVALKAQSKVNADLKKLVVASVGDQLSTWLERLSGDCARLEHEVGELKRGESHLIDELDRYRIEADMWRSKFVAGRVMLDELAGWKAQLSLRYRETSSALQTLLQERHQLRGDMADLYDHLCKSLVVTGSSGHRPAGTVTNSLELSVANRQLGRELSEKLDKTSSHESRPQQQQQLGSLPTSAGHPVQSRSLLDHFKEYTDGERAALEALGNQPALSADQTSRYWAAYNSPNSQAFEKGTLDGCRKCRGEVKVV